MHFLTTSDSICQFCDEWCGSNTHITIDHETKNVLNDSLVQVCHMNFLEEIDDYLFTTLHRFIIDPCPTSCLHQIHCDYIVPFYISCIHSDYNDCYCTPENFPPAKPIPPIFLAPDD